MDNNQILADVYVDYVPQIITIWPIMWKHERYGDWFVAHRYEA